MTKKMSNPFALDLKKKKKKFSYLSPLDRWLYNFGWREIIGPESGAAMWRGILAQHPHISANLAPVKVSLAPWWIHPYPKFEL